MVKNKKYIIVGSLLSVALIVGVALALNHKSSQPTQLSLLSDGTSAEVPSQPAGADGASANIPLNQTAPAKISASNNNLNVSSDTAANRLGQITPSQNGQSGNKPSSSSSSSSPIDPTTFGQYEKYKDGTGALFGEVQKGDGAELSDGKKAAVYYRGWLTNGTIFDQSKPGSDGKLQPFIFTMGAHQVIPGWEQALAGMKVGGVRLVIVPPSVGYGATGQGSIPPNSVLVFQVQLAAVQ